MFRQLARWLQEQSGQIDSEATALAVFDLHPAQLARFLDEAWFARDTRKGQVRLFPALAYPQRFLEADLNSLLKDRLLGVDDDIYPLFDETGKKVGWDHLIYSYMIENTRMFEIFGKVLYELLHGERLEIPDEATQRWMRATEELFFRDPPPFGIASVTSSLRPDPRAVRRNAYYRMFGMDLNHGGPDNRPYPYAKPAIANRQFVTTLEELLREVWRAIENSYNTSGANASDTAAIANLAQSLRDMLVSRRGSAAGALSREEFVAVATMSWFHLTISFDGSPVVKHLRATAASPEERLRKIGERVGVPAHSRTYNYLKLATAMSRFLLAIEADMFNDPGAAELLYRAPRTNETNPIRDDVLTIITQWSIATGRDMKAGKVTVTPRSVEPSVRGNGRAGVFVARETVQYQPGQTAVPAN